MKQDGFDFPDDNQDIYRPPSRTPQSEFIITNPFDQLSPDPFNLQSAPKQQSTAGNSRHLQEDQIANSPTLQQNQQSQMNDSMAFQDTNGLQHHQNHHQLPPQHQSYPIQPTFNRASQNQQPSLLFPDPDMANLQDNNWYMPGAFNAEENVPLWLQMDPDGVYEANGKDENDLLRPEEPPENPSLERAFQPTSSQLSLSSARNLSMETAQSHLRNPYSESQLENGHNGSATMLNGRVMSSGRIYSNEGTNLSHSRRVSGRSPFDDYTQRGSMTSLLHHQFQMRQPSISDMATETQSPGANPQSNTIISPARAFGDTYDNPDVSPSTDAGSVDVHHQGSYMTPEMDDIALQSSAKYWQDRKSTFGHRTSFLAANADFSPLTATTSLTPSASSVHLTQPSFFSANQFYRTLFDHPPSLIHRPSLDMYSRGRVSLDSQGSSVNHPTNTSRNNPRSFASYFPFMGDRERKLPPTADWDKLPQNQQQPRQLIRSIFNKNVGDPATEGSPQLMTDIVIDSPLDDVDFTGENAGENPIPMKKAKRSRINLFNRFKSGKNQPDSGQQEPLKNEVQSSITSSDKDDFSNISSAPNMQQQSMQNSLNSAASSGLAAMAAQPAQLGQPAQPPSDSLPTDEPDYASLFQNVGKRRLGGMKQKKGIKAEPESPRFAPTNSNERSPLKTMRPSNEHSDTRLASSVPFSNASSKSISEDDSGNPSNALSSFASASKRILGLRLLKKKTNQVKIDQQPDLLEIDLESLDLPPDTEIIPKINPKIRTRGRKENKEADLFDQSKIFVCSYCDRRFKRQEHLKRHFRSLHTSEKPYECPNCQKKFSRTDNLNQHLKVHKQEEEEAAAKEAGLQIP